MNDILTFRRMVIPVAIQVVWWLGNLMAVIGFFGGLTQEPRGVEVLILIIGVPMWLLFWRFLCELVMVIFRMNETLSDIRRELRKNQ